MRSETLLFNFHSARIFSKILTLLVFFAFLGALDAQAQIVDQTNASTNNFGFTVVNSSQDLGQSFVAGLTGDFNAFHFMIGDYPGYFVAGDFQLKLYAGDGYGGTLLATKNFTISTFPGANSEYTVSMPSGISMVAGNTYTVLLQGITGAIVLNSTYNDYANGMIYYSGINAVDYDLWFKTYIVDPSGSALNFDGADDKVVLGNALNAVLDPLNTITVEAWVKTTNDVFNGVIVGNYFSSNNEMQFLLRRDGNQFALWVDDGTTGYKVVNSGVATVTLNTWQHVAGVWDGSSLYIYVDGVLKGTTTGVNGSSFASTNNVVQMGSNSYSTPESFAGSVDEVRIWNRALGQCEIQNNMNDELPSGQTGLLAYYQFNQGIAAGNNTAITSLTDSSGNNYNGTLINFALTGAASNWVSPGGVATGTASPVYTAPNVNAVTSQTVCNNSLTTSVAFSSSTTGSICGTANENNSITLTAPSGTVFTAIPFASYGTPDGSCGSFTIGSCHASNSVSIVSGLALGQNNVTITATNGVFGDPCMFTSKRLYIQAVYDNTFYNWTNDTPSIGLAASGTGNIPSFAAVNNGSTPIVATITVTPTTANGCPGTSTQFTITVNPTPVAPTGSGTQSFSVGTFSDATIEDLVVNPAMVAWYASSADATTGTNPLATGTQIVNGATYYAVNNENTCSSIPFEVTVAVTLGTDNFDVSGFKYYPNPTSGMLTISNSIEISEITVINLLGQTLFTKKANALEVQVDLSSLPMATYLINIVSEGQTKTIKILKRE